MGESSVDDLLRRVSMAGVEVSLYYGIVVTRPQNKLPTLLQAEIMKRSKEIRAHLATKVATARSRSNVAHKWVIRLGDNNKSRTNGAVKPAYLACGPADWCQQMIRQSQELSDPSNKYERTRWLVLEQDQVGAAINDDRGVMVASVVVLPHGVELGGPANSLAEIVSACAGCLVPPISDEKVAKIVKNDD